MKRRRWRSQLWIALVSSALVAVAMAAASSAVTACSSSTSGAAPLESGTTVDEGAAPAPEQDAAAPDVLADSLNAPCDPIKQDCVDPSLRCAIVYLGGEYVTGCQPPWEPAKNKEGEVCSRTAPGHDDCVKGLNCLPDGVTATSCHKICAADLDCGPGGKCGAITTTPPYYGVCWRACTPFTAECPSATCSGAHLDVDQSTLFEACREIGAGVLGSSCTAQFDCAEDMNCQGKAGFKCKAMCDDAHPCDGGTCAKSAGLPNNGGVCQ